MWPSFSCLSPHTMPGRASQVRQPTCHLLLLTRGGRPSFSCLPPTMPGRAGEEAPGSAGREGGLGSVGERLAGGEELLGRRFDLVCDKAGKRAWTFTKKIGGTFQNRGIRFWPSFTRTGERGETFLEKLGDKILTQCHISQEHQLTSVLLNIKMFHWSVRESWEQRGSV